MSKRERPWSEPVILSYFHARGLEVLLQRVSVGVQIQFFPWPPPDRIGNCVVLGQTMDDDLGVVWHVFPTFAPASFPEAMEIPPVVVSGTLEDALQVICMLREEYLADREGGPPHEEGDVQ